MSNNNNNNNNTHYNAMKRVERLKTHFVVSANPLLNNEENNNTNFSSSGFVLERQETSFFSSPFGVRSLRVCFFLRLVCCVLCAFYHHP